MKKRIESCVYIEDNNLGKNKTIMQLKGDLTLCGFGVRNIKQSTSCLNVKNRKLSNTLGGGEGRGRPGKQQIMKHRDAQIQNGRETQTPLKGHCPFHPWA